MKVKKDNTFYTIPFIDSILEVPDIDKIINDELIRHKLLTEDDPPIISILSDINTFKIIILIEDGYELYLDDNFFKMLGFSDKVLKRYLQRSNLTPQINSINYLKIYCNIIDNKNNPYYLLNVFIKSGLAELTVYTEPSIFKKQKIINDNFNYIEFEFLDEKNDKIEMTERVQPHFCPWKNVCFPIFPHGEKWEKKYMEREGKVFISLSFHILFPIFPHGKKWKNIHFSMGKNGVGPPPHA